MANLFENNSYFENILGEIKKRRFVRNKKARDEHRREKMIEQEENKKLGKCNELYK